MGEGEGEGEGVGEGRQRGEREGEEEGRERDGGATLVWPLLFQVLDITVI